MKTTLDINDRLLADAKVLGRPGRRRQPGQQQGPVLVHKDPEFAAVREVAQERLPT